MSPRNPSGHGYGNSLERGDDERMSSRDSAPIAIQMQAPVAAHIAGVGKILPCVADGYGFMLELNASLLKFSHVRHLTFDYELKP